jgi:ABC-2 type transport system ATP-binding protein
LFAIETHQLEKCYGGKAGQAVQAVRGVNLSITSGEIYALLGPNGAGKTTTLAILTTLLLPSAGAARVAGFDVVEQPAEVRRRIGVTFQEIVIDQELTGRQVLDFHGQLYGQHRRQRQVKIDELARLVELTTALDRRAGQYSGGMKRRLELARGLMTEPNILFLDEPTQGLDPQNRASIWQYIRQLRDEGGLTLLLTTHYMEEAEALADRVGIIDHGQLVVEGKPADLVRQLGADVIALIGSGDAQTFMQAAQAQPYVSQIAHHASDNIHRLQVGVDVGERRLAAVIGLAVAAGFHVQEVSVARPSLADIFLKYTGRTLRDQ